VKVRVDFAKLTVPALKWLVSCKHAAPEGYPGLLRLFLQPTLDRNVIIS